MPRTVTSELLPLFEFSRVVNNSHDLDFILATVLRTLMGKMLTSRGVILAWTDGTDYRYQLAKGIDGVGADATITIPWRQPKPIRLSPGSPVSWRKELHDRGIRILLPVFSRDHLVGFLGLGERLNGAPYTKDDLALIGSLVDLSGSAIEKALIIQKVHDANRSLDRKVQELNTLFDLSKEFNTGLDHDRVIRLITFALMGQIGVRQYAICLLRNDRMDIISSRGISEAAFSDVLPRLCDLDGPSILSDLTKRRQYRQAAAALLKLGFTAVVPMHSSGKTSGLILVGKRLQTGDYAPADLEFLSAMGNLAAISIENARLFTEAIDKQRMEDELLIAREIQQGLLPEKLPRIPSLDLAAVNIPSREVGGDYYDIIQRSETEVVLAIGDVSGKGTPAALLMANIQAALRALAPSDESMSIITGRINDIAASNTRGGTKFITFFWGILDTQQHTLRYVNAGHNPPILLRADGQVELLDRGGLILGIFKTDIPYQEGSVRMEKGDILFMYTDGISEAMNREGVDFTEENMLEVVRRSTSRSSQKIIDAVVHAVSEHVQGHEQSDDMTLVVLKMV